MRHVFAIALVLGFVAAAGNGIAEDRPFDTQTPPQFRDAITSETFIQGLPRGSFQEDAGTASFPFSFAGKEPAKPDLTQGASQAMYSTAKSMSQSESVAPVQYQSPASMTPIGSGVATSQLSSLQDLTLGTSTSSPSNYSETQLSKPPAGWRDRLGLDTANPNFLVGFEAFSLYRSNDSVGPYSRNAPLQTIDSDLSNRVTVSRLFGGLDRLDFIFAGPFHFEKQSSTSGSVDSNLPLSLAPAYDAADRHQQSHHIKLSSYELNRCSSGDELSQFFYGLRFLDHKERFTLDSTKGASSSQFRLETENFMAGGQIGIDLFRPVSQRLSVGFGSLMGVYGNFASASVRASNGATSLLDASDSGLRLSSMFGVNGRLKYQVSKGIVASGGYELWYFPGLATAADQQLASDPQHSLFSLQSDDDQLFRGWSAGLFGRF